MEFEVCIESLEGALLADKFGADRVELCSALHEGGLTPSYGMAQQVVQQSKQAVYAMIRPEAGGFIYEANMLQVMKQDIVAMAKAGVKGVVFGVLKAGNTIDVEANKILIAQAKEYQLELIFHRAFDFTEKPFESLELLIEMGFDRLLTSGLEPKAIEGLDLIKQLHEAAKGRIEIMAGSGVLPENIPDFINSNIDAVHFTAGAFEEGLQMGMGARLISDPHKIKTILSFK
jgi:copper homeostasis protein